jgi:type II secretory pathway component PulF
MALYRYEALDATGRSVRGTTDAGTLVEARAGLREQGLLTVRLEAAVAPPPAQARDASGRGTGLRFLGGRRLDLLAAFSRHLALLLRTGLPLTQALNVLAEQFEDERFREVVQDLAVRVREGASFDQALEAHPRHFPVLFMCMARAGATSGRLAEVLSKVASYYARQKHLWDRVLSALTYPILMCSVGVVVLVFLLAFVVPKVTGVLLEQRRALPWPTEVLLAVSNFIQAWWWALLLLMAVAGWLVSVGLRTERGQRVLDRFFLALPIVGDLLRKQAVARWADTMSNLLASGIPVAQALATVREVLGNRVLAAEVARMERRIVEGVDLSEALKESRYFPKSIGFVVGVGEEAGELAQVLDEVARGYNEEVTVVSGRLADAINPVLIVFLGVVVGFIVAAILLPITDFSQIQ